MFKAQPNSETLTYEIRALKVFPEIFPSVATLSYDKLDGKFVTRMLDDNQTFCVTFYVVLQCLLVRFDVARQFNSMIKIPFAVLYAVVVLDLCDNIGTKQDNQTFTWKLRSLHLLHQAFSSRLVCLLWQVPSQN